MSKPALMAGASRSAQFFGFSGRRRRAADGNDEGEEYGNPKDGRNGEENEDGNGEGEGGGKNGRNGRRSRRANENEDGGDDGDDGNGNGDDDSGRNGRRSRRAEGDDEGNGDDDGARRSRRSRAEDDNQDDDEDEEREMNGRSAAASARRRERQRCCAILEAASDAMGNPALLETALAQMESTHGTDYAVGRVARAARAQQGADRSADRGSRNPRVGSGAPPPQGDSAAAAKGWANAFAKVVGTPQRD